jgi:starvation-inducible DNA-binding protein
MSKTSTRGSVKTSIDLDAATRRAIVDLVNQQLADTLDLYSQTKHAHWNVKGMHFGQLHKLFDELAEGLEAQIDTIAERGTALGGVAHGTLRRAAGASRLPELALDAADGMEYVKVLVQRYAKLAKSTRAAIDAADEAGDTGTADMFTDVSRDLDKWLWFLEAHTNLL